ncbi:MAG: hypothetical protein F4X72_08845 [Dehalococcoidia bacterium]|nr:hypothetical protein [Dehalococcoidia bacterium]
MREILEKSLWGSGLKELNDRSINNWCKGTLQYVLRNEAYTRTDVKLWLDTSTDEAVRMKDSRDPVDNEPLLAH